MALGVGLGPLVGVHLAQLMQRQPERLFGPGRKVLMLGDSHSTMEYGKDLRAKIEGTGSTVTAAAKVGVSPRYYLDKVDELLKSKPDTIVISLGANFRDASSQGAVDRQVKALEEKIRQSGSKAKIVWVGPPWIDRDTKDKGTAIRAFDEKMAKAVGQGSSYYPSSEHTRGFSSHDGEHYARAEGKKWAAAVFDVLDRAQR